MSTTQQGMYTTDELIAGYERALAEARNRKGTKAVVTRARLRQRIAELKAETTTHKETP